MSTSSSTAASPASGAPTEIAGIGFYDSPEPGKGNLLGHAAFPGGAKLRFYPEAGQTVVVPPGGIEVSLRRGVRARPIAAAVTIESGQVRLHPPASEMVAAARVCQQLGIPFAGPDTARQLALQLVAKHYPEAMLAAGRKLSSDERMMSIAYAVDIQREANETAPDVLARVRPQLQEYGLIDQDTADTTLRQYLQEGLALLAKHDLLAWKQAKRGRPKRKS